MTADVMVCLEQAALDGGKLDIGLLLTLQEDPLLQSSPTGQWPPTAGEKPSRL